MKLIPNTDKQRREGEGDKKEGKGEGERNFPEEHR